MLLYVWVLVIKKNKMEHQHHLNFTLFSKTWLVQYKKELPVTSVGVGVTVIYFVSFGGNGVI